jgi:hypothetical protein
MVGGFGKALSAKRNGRKRKMGIKTLRNRQRASPIRSRQQDYLDYVEHPRFGKAPRFTGLDPNPDAPDVHLHPNTGCITARQRERIEELFGRQWLPFDSIEDCKIAGTAIAADISKQTPASLPATHYYDLDKECRDCRKRFIFFAVEQKHWYEDLRFPLEADAVHCPECRKKLQWIARMRRRHEELFHIKKKTVEQGLESAACCLVLIEQGLFPRRQTTQVRRLLNSIPESERKSPEFATLRSRLLAVENKFKEIVK